MSIRLAKGIGVTLIAGLLVLVADLALVRRHGRLAVLEPTGVGQLVAASATLVEFDGWVIKQVSGPATIP